MTVAGANIVVCLACGLEADVRLIEGERMLSYDLRKQQRKCLATSSGDKPMDCPNLRASARLAGIKA